MYPNRPPTTTSWVQMSAAGATPLATAAGQATAPRRTNYSNLSSQQQQQQQQQPASLNLSAASDQISSTSTAAAAAALLLDQHFDQTKLSFISTSSSNSSSSSSPAAAAVTNSSSSAQQRPTAAYHHQQFATTASSPSSSRLASVLGAPQAHMSAAGGGGGGGGGSALLSSSSATAATSLTSSLTSSSSSTSRPTSLQSSSGTSSGGGGGGGTGAESSHSAGQMQLVAQALPQLQAAMGELYLGGGCGGELSLGAHFGDESVDLLQEQQRESNRKLRLQLYVFVLRCISYPFNAKQTATGDHRQQLVKLRKAQLEQIVQAHSRFIRATNSFLPGKCAHSHLSKQLAANQLKQLDELYERAHVTFNRRFLHNERMRMLVEAECCSQQDLRDLFKQNAERILKESALFIGAHRQQQQLNHHRSSASYHQQQQQRVNNYFDSDATAAAANSLNNQRDDLQLNRNSSNSNNGGNYQFTEQAVSASSQLLANRDAIINSWQIKFESIIRDDYSSGPSSSGADLGAYSPGTPTSPANDQHHLAQQQQQQQLQQQQQQQTTLTKEQLYQMFQNILNVKKFEHQLLYNALQLDSSDEQAAAIRRELDGRVARIAELERNKKLLPKFVLKEMESLFIEETRMAVNKLMVNLDSLPVMKGGAGSVIGGALVGLGGAQSGAGSSSASESRGVYSGLQKFRRYNSSASKQMKRQTKLIRAAQRIDKVNRRQANERIAAAAKLAQADTTGCVGIGCDAATAAAAAAAGSGGFNQAETMTMTDASSEARHIEAEMWHRIQVANKLGKLQHGKRSRQKQVQLVDPGKHPVSNFLLKRANEPLWSLTFNSLSSFGKIAAQASLTRDGLAESHLSEPTLSKLDVILSFNIEVIVMEVRGLRNLAPTREIYCTMEIEGSETGRLQTEHVQAKKPLWDTQGDFTTNHPLPILKIKLYAVNPSMLSLEDKELGKLVLRPTVLSAKAPEWCTMVPTSGSDKSSWNMKDSASASSSALDGHDYHHHHHQHHHGQQHNDQQLRIRVVVRMDRPQQLKHCGYLYGVGKSTWRKFKRRYHILIQVSQYTFVMCDFRDKKSKPTEMLQLDGYTVDYIEPPTDLIMEHCSEITSAEYNHHHSSSHGSSTFGLAGRLAKPFMKQQFSQQAAQNSDDTGQSASLSGSAGCGSGGTGGGSGGGGLGAIGTGLGLVSGADSTLSGGGGGGGSGNEQPSAIQTAAALSDELHNKFYFNVVKEGDSVVFACDDEQECFGWVMALYRATGQAHKPTPLRDQYSSSNSHYIDAAFAYNASMLSKMNGNSSGSSGATTGLGSSSGVGGGAGCAGSSAASAINKGGVKSSVDVADQRARKHGMDEFIGADPCKFQHNQLFKYLQNETLQYRLNDQHCSLGWFSPGQLFVLDEYCARYGVRTCYRHLTYLNSLLDFNLLRGYFIDHTLLNYGYDFCSSFVSGQSGQLNPMSSVNFDLRPDGTVGTVTVEERDLFHSVKTKLLKMIERQIANFSYCFPYGKPEGSLRAALSLLERVLMKQETLNQMNSMIQNEEVRNLIRKCLEQAALNDYTRLSGQAILTPADNQQQPQQPQQQLVGASTLMSPTSSGQSTPSASGSPVPFNADLLESGARKRAQSNLSSTSSIATIGSQSTGSGGGGGGGQGQQSAAGSFNDSVRRHNNQQRTTNQQQQQQQADQQQQRQQQLMQNVTMAMIINNEHVRPQEKLVYLIRLAELCCEQVEENNEYFSDAFAWHSDLMMEHFELFWSLFSVDMDKILNELGGSSAALNPQQQQQQQQQTPLGRTVSSSSGCGSGGTGGGGGGNNPATLGTGLSSSGASAGTPPGSSDLLGINNRDIFALFQVLNNHMRKSSNLECRKFRAHLCDTFKPKLLRYIDIMESTLTRMVFKACEKEGLVNCQIIEQMFMRLDDLQRFVLAQLRWPDEQLAEQLHQRLKLIAYELCDASVQRTLQAFQQLEKRSNKWTATTTSYNIPIEMVQMINLTLDTRNRSLKLCTFNGFDQMSYNSKIDKLVDGALGEMQPGLMAKMLNALDSTLNKLARFDEGNLLAPILSLTYKQGISSSGRDIGKQYVSFVSNCCDMIRHKINDEIWIVTLLEDWYAAQMNTICNWLSERIDHSLHDVQLVALTNIMPKIYADMSLQGVSEDKLIIKAYQTITNRLKMEEAASLASGELFEQQPSTSIFNMKFY